MNTVQIPCVSYIRDVRGYEELYRVCSDGKIISKTDGKLLHSRIDRGGYETVRLRKEGKISTHFVHRLVAGAFLDNPESKREVNHINGNKLDNRLENLEWVTHAENVQHAYNNGLISKTTSMQVIDICSGRLFSSVKEAADNNLIPYSTCKNYLNGNRKNPTCLRYFELENKAAA